VLAIDDSDGNPARLIHPTNGCINLTTVVPQPLRFLEIDPVLELVGLALAGIELEVHESK
jgi:hypothetical protein